MENTAILGNNRHMTKLIKRSNCRILKSIKNHKDLNYVMPSYQIRGDPHKLCDRCNVWEYRKGSYYRDIMR